MKNQYDLLYERRIMKSKLTKGIFTLLLCLTVVAFSSPAPAAAQTLENMQAVVTPAQTLENMQAVVTPAQTQAPTTTSVQAKFRVPPTVILRPVTDVIETDQDGIVELYMNNPSLNDVVLKVDAQINVPSGFHVSGQGFALAASAGTVYGIFEVPPGTARTISVLIKADKSARLGAHTLQFSGLYYPGDDKDKFQPVSLTYSVTVKAPSSVIPTPQPTTIIQTPAPATPGFGLLLAVISIFVIARLRSKK